MKEKLLALLVAKFAGVPEAMLEGIATKKAGSVSDEAQLQSIADGIDFGQVLQSNVDKKITESNKLAIQNYENTHKLKDGKPISTEPPKTDPDEPTWFKTYREKQDAENLALKTKLEGYEKKETQSVLSKKVLDKLYEGKNDQQKFVLDMMIDANGINIESEDQVDAVVASYTEKFTQKYQQAVEKNVVIDIPAGGHGPMSDTKALAGQIEAGTKQIVEQSKK
jgi:hypothetical protein